MDPPDVLTRDSGDRPGSERLGCFSPPVRADEVVLVTFDDWPSWLFVLPSLGINKILIDTKRPEDVPAYFHKTCTLYFSDQVEDHPLFEGIKWCFTSGSPGFVNRACSRFGQLKVWAASPVRKSGGLERFLASTTLCWRRVSHEDCGGVTSGSFWIGTNSVSDWDVRLDPNKRRLCDVLSTTEDGSPCDPPSPEEETNGRLLRLQDWRLRRKVASVFSKTRWTSRRLTLKELGAAFDLPVELQKSLSSSTGTSGSAPPSFVMGTPSKALMSAFDALVDSLGTGSPSTETAPSRKAKSAVPALMTPVVNPLPEGPAEQRSDDAKAAKADDAAADVKLWDASLRQRFPKALEGMKDEILEEKVTNPLRRLAMRWWKRNLRRSAADYLRNRHGIDWCSAPRVQDTVETELNKDRSAIADALGRGSRSSYWDWDAGSTLFFWRWHQDFRRAARDGVPVFVKGPLPKYRKPQPKPNDPEKKEKVKKKLAKVRARGYIELGLVLSLTGYFDVPKAETDIRMVYDATACGLNDAVWAPNFFMPSPESLYRLMDSSSIFADIDLGEFFLNFPLDARLRPYAGVDLSPYFGKDSKAVWERWGRCLMGFKPSPYNTAQTAGWSEETIRGNPQDEALPFCWDYVELNLPGSRAYDPRRPWVSKRRKDGSIASDFVSYCDDLRPVASSFERCREATRRIAQLVGYFGIQDAPRKRRFPSRHPGAWAGSMVFSDAEKGAFATISQARWDKTKTILHRLDESLSGDAPGMEHQQLLSDRGFLLYVSRVYPAMRPYLKGLHLTIDGWREGRNDEGWKVPISAWEKYDRSGMWDCAEGVRSVTDPNPPPPSVVRPVPRLRADVRALLALFSRNEPAVRCIRPASRILQYGQWYQHQQATPTPKDDTT